MHSDRKGVDRCGSAPRATPNLTLFSLCAEGEKSNEVNHWIRNADTEDGIMVIWLSIRLRCWKDGQIKRGSGWLRIHLMEHEPTQEHSGHEAPPQPHTQCIQAHYTKMWVSLYMTDFHQAIHTCVVLSLGNLMAFLLTPLTNTLSWGSGFDQF